MAEHRNHITFFRFREGICQTLDLDETASDEQKDALIHTIETKWWFCGGKDTQIDLDINDDEGEEDGVSPKVLERWEKLWDHNFPDSSLPEATTTCVCGRKGLRYNCYITDGEQVVIIGRVCLYQFLHKQARNMNNKRCDRCFEPHRNRIDNYCKACREWNKEDAKRQEKEEEEKRLRYLQEQRVRVKLKIQAQVQARERREIEEKWERMTKEQEEREKLAHICVCGFPKQPQYNQCYTCLMEKREKESMGMTEQQKNAFICSCGKQKKPQWGQCYTCHMDVSSK